MTIQRTPGLFHAPDGAPLWFETAGEGLATPAVLCDGLGCDGFIWRYLWRPLTSDRRVLHWNYRGHGKSGVPTDDTRLGIEYCVDDLARLMEAQKLNEAVLFGHSMGVQVVLEFHRRHPGKVKGLVLLCGSWGTPLDTWHDHTMLRVAFPYMQKLVESAPSAARSVTSRLMKTQLALMFSVLTELNPKLVQLEDFGPYMDHLASMHPLYFVRTLDSLKDHSAWEHLPHIDVPTLVVGGEMDRFTPVWLAERMAETIPKSDYLYVKGGSHTAPIERPGLVNEAIDRFLSQRVGGL